MVSASSSSSSTISTLMSTNLEALLLLVLLGLLASDPEHRSGRPVDRHLLDFSFAQDLDLDFRPSLLQAGLRDEGESRHFLQRGLDRFGKGDLAGLGDRGFVLVLGFLLHDVAR